MVELVGIDTPYVLHDEKKIPKKRKMRNFGGYAIFRPPLEGEPKEISKNGFLHQNRDEKVGIYIKYEIGFVWTFLNKPEKTLGGAESALPRAE